MTRDPLTVVKVTQDAALGVPEGRPARLPLTASERSCLPWSPWRSEVSRPPSGCKAEPQMATLIAEPQSKPGPAISPHRPGRPLGRCRRLPLLSPK